MLGVAATLAFGCKASAPRDEAPAGSKSSEAAQPPAAPAPPAVSRGSWQELNDLPEGLGRPRATLLSDGRVFVFGDGEARRGAILDVRTGQWATTSDASVPRAHHGQSLLPDGRVLLTGGPHVTKSFYVLRGAETFDPDTDEWAKAANMPGRRSGHAQVTRSDGRVVVAGGVPGGMVGPIREIDIYEPLEDRWKPLATLAIGRYEHAAAPFGDGHLFVVGGQGSDGALASAEVCEAGERRCRHVPLGGRREGVSATRLPSGLVLLVGGVKQRSGPPPERLFDPASQKLAAIATPAERRVGHSATVLKDGNVLVVGGAPDATRPSAEVYVPDRDLWAPVASPAVRRHGHAAVRLLDGSVLVLGGVDDRERSVLSVERWTP